MFLALLNTVKLPQDALQETSSLECLMQELF